MEAEGKVPLRVYKTGELITNGDQLPVSFEQRTSTDIFCTIITSLFAITMFVMALLNLKIFKLQQMTYPTDSAGRRCTLDNPSYNYLYFPSPNNPANRICVASCPTSSASTLNCWPTASISCAANTNPQFQVVIYPTYASRTSLGLYCLPTDPLLKDQLLIGAGVQTMFNFVAAYESIGVSLICGTLLGLLGILLFSCMPGVMAYTSIILGGLSSIAMAVILLVSLIANQNLLAVYQTIIYFLIAILLLVGLMLVWGAFFRRHEISLSVNYIQQAAACLWQAPGLILLSFVFILLLAGLTALCTFQILAYWSASTIVFYPNQVYYRPHSTFATVMTSLCTIEFLWGLCFLKQAFNFLLSGMAVTWHFTGQRNFKLALARLFRFHWGSVAGGAFLLNILYPFDLIYDLLKPNKTVGESTCLSCLCCCCCERLLDLARTEAMTMINMLGTPYCNSSRLCEQIVFYSNYTSGSESANRFVRIGSHVLLACLATLGSWIFMITNGKSSILAVTVSFAVNLFVPTFFVCLLKDMAETLMFCDLVENCIDNRDQIEYSNGNTPVAKKLFPDEGYEVIRTH